MNYLHCFDLFDRYKCLNFTTRGTIESFLSIQLLTNSEVPNPVSLEKQELENYDREYPNEMLSPRMMIIYKASLLRNSEYELKEEDELVIKKADLEIDFELQRRIINPGAPSRLSCIYLVKNNDEGRLVLRDMLVNIFANPIVCEVDIFNKMELVKCDHNWIDNYLFNKNERYIENYWTGKELNLSGGWEYLLEGSIILTNTEQIQKIREHTKKNFSE